MKHYYADKTCLNILKFLILVLTFILLALTAYFLSFIPIVMITLCIIFFAVGFFLALIYLPVYFKNLNYYVSDDKIIKESGFYFRKKQIIRLNKIQFTTSVSTPFSRLTGLNFIILYAYGGIMTVMFLSDRDFAELTYNLRF
ncbi:PH domain-containing protein [Porcipelethomonas sp.]|uniref:PH domain-containing protein n=1 Tax=Porcipelethomonas sp. TaxID=2981675 RepID=UPI003EF22A60